MAPAPATAGRTRFDIGDIVRQHRAALEAAVPLDNAQRRVLSAVAQCRTAALGGHLDRCTSAECGWERPAYNSCRNRHCPKCQGLAQEKWIQAREARLLPVRHFHVVATLPGELRPLAKAFPREVFGALLRCTGEALVELGYSRFDGQLGATAILHTWTRELDFHPHVHAIVTAGGLSPDGKRWRSSGRKYLFPVRVMGELLRGKLLDALRRLHAGGAFGAWKGFAKLTFAMRRKHWLVYAKRPFGGADTVLKYLGRYTHRVGIANSRLEDVTDDHVTFRTKNGKTKTLAPIEFLRRFVAHVLPRRFVKIRHFGLYAGASADTRHRAAVDVLATRRGPPATPLDPAAPPADWRSALCELTGRDVDHCPLCGARVVLIPVPYARSRGPPSTRTAA